MFDLIAIGDATVDISLRIADDNPHIHLIKQKQSLTLPFGGKTSVEDGGIYVGGNASNVAVGIAKTSLRSALIATLGKDNNGSFILEELARHGVDTTLSTVDKHFSTRYSVILEYHGERTILAPHPKRSYTIPKLPEHTWLYVTSMGIGSNELLGKIASKAKKTYGTKIAANPGSYQLRAGLATFKKFLPFVDVLFVNKEEAQILCGSLEKKETHLLRALHTLGAKSIVLTNGKHGAWTFHKDMLYSSRAFPAHIVAKTGAGDACASGTIAAILHGIQLPEAMLYGLANSAGVVTKYGAHNGLLTLLEMKHLVQKYAPHGVKQIKK